MTDRPYEPISCTVHDRLLAAATLRQPVDLEIGSPGEAPAQVRGVIADVYSRGGAEYLRLVDGSTFRLDELRSLDGGPVGPSDAGDGR